MFFVTLRYAHCLFWTVVCIAFLQERNETELHYMQWITCIKIDFKNFKNPIGQLVRSIITSLHTFSIDSIKFYKPSSTRSLGHQTSCSKCYLIKKNYYFYFFQNFKFIIISFSLFSSSNKLIYLFFCCSIDTAKWFILYDSFNEF